MYNHGIGLAFAPRVGYKIAVPMNTESIHGMKMTGVVAFLLVVLCRYSI